MSVFELFNQQLQEVFRAILPSGSGLNEFVIANAFLVMTLILIIFVLIILAFSFFMDFITDVWKIPFAIGVDALKYIALFNPWFGVIGAVVGALIFIFLSDFDYVKWFFAVLSVASCLFVSFFVGDLIGLLVALVPLNTVMMVLSTILD